MCCPGLCGATEGASCPVSRDQGKISSQAESWGPEDTPYICGFGDIQDHKPTVAASILEERMQWAEVYLRFPRLNNLAETRNFDLIFSLRGE